MTDTQAFDLDKSQFKYQDKTIGKGYKRFTIENFKTHQEANDIWQRYFMFKNPFIINGESIEMQVNAPCVLNDQTGFAILLISKSSY